MHLNNQSFDFYLYEYTYVYSFKYYTTETNGMYMCQMKNRLKLYT